MVCEALSLVGCLLRDGVRVQIWIILSEWVPGVSVAVGRRVIVNSFGYLELFSSRSWFRSWAALRYSGGSYWRFRVGIVLARGVAGWLSLQSRCFVLTAWVWCLVGIGPKRCHTHGWVGRQIGLWGPLVDIVRGIAGLIEESEPRRRGSSFLIGDD